MAENGKKFEVVLSAKLVGFFIVIGICNLLIFLTVLVTFWRPDVVPVKITTDVAMGLHLQLFEAVLTSLTIGLAVFGFAGYAAIKDAAERRVDSVLKATLQAYGLKDPGSDVEGRASQVPDLSGIPKESTEPKPEENNL
jgi:hypothetical protein